MKLSSSANKLLSLSALLLLLLLPLQVYLNGLFVPGFARDPDTLISKTILTYGPGTDGKKSRTMQYQLEPYLWNHFLLMTTIQFDSGEKLKTQFLITFWPQKLYSIKYINQLVEAEETKYFDPPEQHVLFDGGDEDFQVLVENPHRYCYIQLSNQAVQCVDVH